MLASPKDSSDTWRRTMRSSLLATAPRSGAGAPSSRASAAHAARVCGRRDHRPRYAPRPPAPPPPRRNGRRPSPTSRHPGLDPGSSPPSPPLPSRLIPGQARNDEQGGGRRHRLAARGARAYAGQKPSGGSPRGVSWCLSRSGASPEAARFLLHKNRGQVNSRKTEKTAGPPPHRHHASDGPSHSRRAESEARRLDRAPA
jgi:hypothetical protein